VNARVFGTHNLLSYRTAIMYTQLDMKLTSIRLKHVFEGVFLPLLIAWLFISVGFAVWFGPSNFRLIGSDSRSHTAYLRAAVELGDTHLIDEVFFDSLVQQYPLVFAAYLKQDEWVERLNDLEARSAQSRDVLVALAVLHERMGEALTAATYWERVGLIDPNYVGADVR